MHLRASRNHAIAGNGSLSRREAHGSAWLLRHSNLGDMEVACQAAG